MGKTIYRNVENQEWEWESTSAPASTPAPAFATHNMFLSGIYRIICTQIMVVMAATIGFVIHRDFVAANIDVAIGLGTVAAVYTAILYMLSAVYLRAHPVNAVILVMMTVSSGVAIGPFVAMLDDASAVVGSIFVAAFVFFVAGVYAQMAKREMSYVGVWTLMMLTIVTFFAMTTIFYGRVFEHTVFVGFVIAMSGLLVYASSRLKTSDHIVEATLELYLFPFGECIGSRHDSS
jgi:hypothetical protein